MAHGNGCDIVRKTLPALKEIREKYRAQGVEFLLIDSNLQDGRDAIAQEAAEFGIDFPILVDETQLIGESLGVARTADVFVIDPKTWKLDVPRPGRRSAGVRSAAPAATKPYLIDALDAAARRASRSRSRRSTRSVASSTCPSATDATAHAQISYSEQIAPLLTAKCAPAAIAPAAVRPGR